MLESLAMPFLHHGILLSAGKAALGAQEARRNTGGAKSWRIQGIALTLPKLHSTQNVRDVDSRHSVTWLGSSAVMHWGRAGSVQVSLAANASVQLLTKRTAQGKVQSMVSSTLRPCRPPADE
jgi:hypothetical protein